MKYLMVIKIHSSRYSTWIAPHDVMIVVATYGTYSKLMDGHRNTEILQ